LDYIDGEILSNIFETDYSAYKLYTKFKNTYYERDVSKINIRLKKLEAANLIKRTNKKDIRNAIFYKITSIGLIFLYADIKQSISFGDILRYNKYTLFEILVFQFLEKQTILDIYNGNTNKNAFNKIKEDEDLSIVYENIIKDNTNNTNYYYDDDKPYIQLLITNYLRNCCNLILNFCNKFYNGLTPVSKGIKTDYRFKGVKLPSDQVIRKYIEYLDNDELNLILDQSTIDELKRYQVEINKKSKKVKQEHHQIDYKDLVNPDKEPNAEYFASLNNIGYEYILFPKSKFYVNNESPPYPLNFNRIDLTEQLEWEIKSFFFRMITRNLALRFYHGDGKNELYSDICLFFLRDNKFKELINKIKDEFNEGLKFFNI
jgi:hypothetical protein